MRKMKAMKDQGFPKVSFARGEISIPNWVRARTGCNSRFCTFVLQPVVESFSNSEIFLGIWRNINYCTGCVEASNY